MSDLSSKTAVVFDHGFYLPIALKLAGEFGKVYYYTPYEKAFPILNEGIIGDGYKEIQRVPDFWDVKDKAEVIIFPDIYHAGLQDELRRQGKRVWGSGRGMYLETDRQLFLRTLAELGLDVPPSQEVKGMTNLTAYLKDKQDIWIKMSRWRGSWETKHWRSWKQDAHHLDNWSVRFGGLKEHVTFLCFPKIETNLEIGADTYSVDGQWPAQMLHGIEAKDSAYFSAVTAKEDMPEQLLPIMEAFSPFLKQNKFRSQWSMEVRVGEEGDFFIDATCRGGLPSTGSQLMALDNFGEILYHGANGDMVEPRYNCKFTAECMVKINGEQGSWETMEVPEELKPHLKLSDCCMVDGQPWFPSDEGAIEELGWLVSCGNSPTETLQRMNELSELLPDGADANVEALSDVIRQVQSESEQGIMFTDQEMPPTEIVLEEV